MNESYNISGLRVNPEDIIQLHLKQEYGELKSDVIIDKLRSQYQLFPNEALYVIDCKYAQLEPLTPNFDRIVGLTRPHNNNLETLYTHTSDLNHDALVRWVRTMVNGIFSKWTLQPELDVCRCLYLSHDNRVILKTTTPLVFDSKTMRYSLGKLTDLTNLVPFKHFGYRFEGPNRDKVLATYQETMNGANVLSARETEVLVLIGEGKCSEEIASLLFISRLTVDKHRRNIIDKMKTSSAMQAFLSAKNLGYF